MGNNYFDRSDEVNFRSRNNNTIGKIMTEEPAVVSDFDSSIYRNQITELAKEN